MLRATGCQGGRTDSPPDSGGDGAFAPGVVTTFRRGRWLPAGGGYRTLIPNP